MKYNRDGMFVNNRSSAKRPKYMANLPGYLIGYLIYAATTWFCTCVWVVFLNFMNYSYL